MTRTAKTAPLENMLSARDARRFTDGATTCVARIELFRLMLCDFYPFLSVGKACDAAVVVYRIPALDVFVVFKSAVYDSM